MHDYHLIGKPLFSIFVDCINSCFNITEILLNLSKANKNLIVAYRTISYDSNSIYPDVVYVLYRIFEKKEVGFKCQGKTLRTIY